MFLLTKIIQLHCVSMVHVKKKKNFHLRKCVKTRGLSFNTINSTVCPYLVLTVSVGDLRMI